MNREKPFVQRDLRIFKNRADRNAELLAAAVALISADAGVRLVNHILPPKLASRFPLQFGNAADHSAMRAEGTGVPEHAFKMLPGGRIGLKLRFEQSHEQRIAVTVCFAKYIIKKK